MKQTKGFKYNVEDVELIEKSTPYQAFFRIDHYALKHKLFNGGWGAELSREVFERGHAVCGLLYDPDLDKLVFIEQFRPGAYAALSSPWFDDQTSPWLIELVAGIIEQGETPEDVIKRESIEEASCEILSLEQIFHYLVSPGGATESMFSFCCRVDASRVGGVHGLKEEGEDIRVFTISVEEAFEWLDQGKIINSMTIIPLQWFRLNHQSIREKWINSN